MSKLRTLRIRLGTSQAEVAIALGLSQGNVSHYERGQIIPPQIAAKFIEFAATKGVHLTFDDLYEEFLPRPQICEASPDTLKLPQPAYRNCRPLLTPAQKRR